jgi:hypothetical protein
MLLSLIETALAAWRLANMLVNEDGPFAIFARLRYQVGIRKIPSVQAADVTVITVSASTLAQGLTCVWCVSVWAAMLLWAPLRPVTGLRRILATSAGAIMVHEAVERIRKGG